MMRIGLTSATAILLACLAFAPAVAADTPQKPASGDSDTYRQLDLFGDVFERVRADYVEDVSDQQLIEAAINGMLNALDPHSNYMNAKNYGEMEVQVRGEFGGLGIEVTMENNAVKVISPIDDTPASKAGVKPGDLIVQIDNDPVSGMSLNDAVEKMRGPVDSEIKLTIQRGTAPPFDLKLKRAVIKIQSVKYHLEGTDVGYIRVTSFNEQTDSGIHAAMTALRGQAGDKLAGVVLDLRNNPGGLLDQAIAVSNDFLPQGEIVSTRGRHSDDAQRYDAKPENDISKGVPLVILINGGSASASEIVAGALQDHHRAVLLGTRSFGKGSVQTIIQLPGHGAIRLTTARYYTPSGRSIQARGIDPDIEVEPAKIEKVETADSRREADLRGALKNTDAKASGASGPAAAPGAPAKPAAQPGAGPATPENSATPTVDVNLMGTEEDYQLTRAIDLLRGVSMFNTHASN
jgi:carboxyl-terminal processing protease